MKFIAMAAVSSVIFFSVFEPNLSVRYGPFVCFGALLIYRPLSFRGGLQFWTVAFLVIWSFLSQFWSKDTHNFEISAVSLASGAIMFLTILHLVVTRKDALVVVTAFVLGCLAGAAQFFLVADDSVAVYSGSRLTQSGDLNANHLSSAAAFGALMLLFMLSSQKWGESSRKAALSLWAAFTALTSVVISTQTRSALLAIGLAFLWFLLLRFFPYAHRAFWPLVSITAIAHVLIPSGLLDSILSGLEFGGRDGDGLSGRSEIWRVARETWAEHPILGVGAGGFRQFNHLNTTSHNVFVEVGVTLGLVGLALFLIMLSVLAMSMVRSLSPFRRHLWLGGFIFCSTPIFSSDTWIYAAVAWTSAAVICRCSGATWNANDLRPPKLKPMNQISIQQRNGFSS